MNFSYPRTIDNGNGEELTFLRLIPDKDGGKVEAINRVRPGSGPPMHVHHLQDECLTVVQGTMAAQVEGEEPVIYGPGDTAMFKRGVVHKFWNAGSDMLVCTGWVGPVYNFEYFLTEVFQSMKDSGGKAPSILDGAYLLSRYKTEFDMMVVPTPVKKILFPIIVMVGKLTGRYRKYATAPAPVVIKR
ncbi:MAG TPA: cupin domain-containing protein [Chryseolinea sp.]